jgi:hypothetical protein
MPDLQTACDALKQLIGKGTLYRFKTECGPTFGSQVQIPIETADIIAAVLDVGMAAVQPFHLYLADGEQPWPHADDCCPACDTVAELNRRLGETTDG